MKRGNVELERCEITVRQGILRVVTEPGSVTVGVDRSELLALTLDLGLEGAPYGGFVIDDYPSAFNPDEVRVSRFF